MKRKLIFAIISLAILIFIIMSVFSYDGNEEKVYEKGELVLYAPAAGQMYGI